MTIEHKLSADLSPEKREEFQQRLDSMGQ